MRPLTTVAIALLTPLVAACASTAPARPPPPPTGAAHTAAPPTETARPTRSRPLLVCSWNIKWFGNKDPSKYRFDWLRKSLQRCDVVAIQEITGAHYEACMRTLKRELNEGADDSYRYRVSKPTGYDDNDDPDKGDYTERFGFLWRNDRVELVGRPRFVSSPLINNAVYRQVPWIARFKLTGGDGFDFDLMSVHAVYNAKLNQVRKAEITAIRNWVVASTDRSEKNAIAIGDFNANPSGQPAHFASVVPSTTTDLRVLLYEPLSAGETSVRTTVPTRDAEPGTRYFQLPVYDHVFVSLATSPALVANPMLFSAENLGVDRFDDAPGWGADEDRKYRRGRVSDHRPIWFKLDYDALDED